jgi:hypothetical protein
VKRRPRLTRARLRELLHYDQDTGEFRWQMRPSNSVCKGDVAGHVGPNAYRRIRIRGRTYFAHRLAWFYMKGRWARQTIDHRDGDPMNNRWNNLRKATPSQNSANKRRPRNNRSGFKGVFGYRGKWRATISKNGKSTFLGTYPTPLAAYDAYVAAARKMFGEFARLE